MYANTDTTTGAGFTQGCDDVWSDWVEPTPQPYTFNVSSIVDVKPRLCMENKTLYVANEQQSGWQRGSMIRIACGNTLRMTSLSTSTDLYDTNKFTMLMWLAYEDQLLKPLTCECHHNPFGAAELRPDKITFQFGCSGKCFLDGRQLCVVVVECCQQQCRWNYATGHFRKGVIEKKQQNVSDKQALLVQMELMVRQLELANRKIDTLEDQLKLIANNQQTLNMMFISIFTSNTINSKK